MQIIKNKNNISIISTFFIFTFFVWAFGLASVSAGGTQTDRGVIGSLCYSPSNETFQVPENENAANACSGGGGTLIQPGQNVPVPICLWGADTKSAQKIESESGKQGCANIGGTVVEQNQPLPTFYVKPQAQAEFESGKGNTNLPEQSESVEAPAPITNEDRERLVNCDGSSDPAKCLNGNPIFANIVYAINIISAGVGVIVTAMIVIGGIQYASAGGNPQKVAAAKTRITNAIIALVAYFFLFAFLQWLVPGGLF